MISKHIHTVMDSYPQNLVEQYFKASSKLKKFDRIVFKRFAPNVTEVLEEFMRLAVKFEEAAIDSYAAMAYLGVAKCHSSSGNIGSEVQAYLKAARAFLRAHNLIENLHTISNRAEYKEGAMRCYTLAVERCPDDAVFKAAIIREMTPLQQINYFDGASTFYSPAHRINELELAANSALERLDFLSALKNLDDIVDNIEERKSQTLYEEILCRIEVLRLLILIVLNLPPSRQSPSHIKLIEFYYHFGNFEEVEDVGNKSGDPGIFVPLELKYAIAEITVAWVERRYSDLKMALNDIVFQFTSLNAAHHFVLSHIAAAVETRV